MYSVFPGVQEALVVGGAIELCLHLMILAVFGKIRGNNWKSGEETDGEDRR